MCVFELPSSRRPPLRNLKVAPMTVGAEFPEISRRRILGGALATGFVFTFHVPVGAAKASQPKNAADGKFALNAFVRIDKSCRLTLVIPQSAMMIGIDIGDA